MARQITVHASTAEYTLSRMMLNTEGIRKRGRQQQRRGREGGDDLWSRDDEVGLADWEGRRLLCGLVFEARLVGAGVCESTISPIVWKCVVWVCLCRVKGQAERNTEA